jgi:hypothetical protein
MQPMEEYRAWVVDRTIIKLRTQLNGKSDLTPTIKKKINAALLRAIAKTSPLKDLKDTNKVSAWIKQLEIIIKLLVIFQILLLFTFFDFVQRRLCNI